MQKYSVTGRKFSGRLRDPTVNLTETQDYDDQKTAEYYGTALAKLGYHVWLYERREKSPLEQPTLTVIAEWSNNGARLR